MHTYGQSAMCIFIEKSTKTDEMTMARMKSTKQCFDEVVDGVKNNCQSIKEANRLTQSAEGLKL